MIRYGQLQMGTPDARPRFVPTSRTNPCFCRRTLQVNVGAPGHLAHHVSDVVDALDLTAFYVARRGGRSTERPLRAVDDGQGADLCLRDGHIRLKCAVARKLEEDVAFRMLAAGNFRGQHRTVCEFRRRHLAAYSDLFVKVVPRGARDETGRGS